MSGPPQHRRVKTWTPGDSDFEVAVASPTTVDAHIDHRRNSMKFLRDSFIRGVRTIATHPREAVERCEHNSSGAASPLTPTMAQVFLGSPLKTPRTPIIRSGPETPCSDGPSSPFSPKGLLAHLHLQTDDQRLS
eukprot:jgi/Botrbrau1/8377/Bobra.0046s0036.1